MKPSSTKRMRPTIGPYTNWFFWPLLLRARSVPPVERLFLRHLFGLALRTASKTALWTAKLAVFSSPGKFVPMSDASGCNCPNGGDSPLSTTASVLGILTFALSLLAYIIALVVITRSAKGERDTALAIMYDTENQMDRIRHYFDAEQRERDPDYQVYADMINKSEVAFRKAKEKIASCLKPFDAHLGWPLSFVGRLRWWYRVKGVATAAARLESRRQHFATIQLTYLLT